jgi:tripartite-type tricarboxylate transporter receptor subunit TctC
MKKLVQWCASALLGLTMGVAAAGPWPEKAVKLVVPYPPGGTTDVLARLIASRLSERLGQPVVIENRAGAGGTLGSATVARAPADGYTLVLGTIGSHGVNYALNEKLAYHPLRDFVGVIPVASVPNVLVVRTDAPYKNFDELIAAAKAAPGQLSHGSTGIGASPQLSLGLLKIMAKVNINEIMYKGGAPVMVDLLGGHLTMAFDAVATSVPMISSGKLRPLAVTSQTRVKALPDVPAIAESYPGFDVVAWYGIWAPAGTPPAVVERLNNEIDAIIRSPEVRDRMAQDGAEVMGGPVEAFAAMHKREFDRWIDFIKQTGIKSD